MATLGDVIQYIEKIEKAIDCYGVDDAYCMVFGNFQESFFSVFTKEKGIDRETCRDHTMELQEKSLKIFKDFRNEAVNQRFN
ncbi:MAG: hypothetical protein ACKUBY_04850 [Candidatus Moraniibacteriota bacterium]